MAEQLARLHSTLKDVPIAKMRVSPNAQRELRPARVAWLASEFDPERLGYPVVNLRDAAYWLIDGQHRVEAAKQFLGEGWEKQSLTCRVYTGLTEKQEADLFDWLNNNLAVSAFDKFKVRCTAGRQVETAVRKVVEKAGLTISRNKEPNCIGATTTLVRIFQRSDGATLARALRIAHESFGDEGLGNSVIDGIARVCERYNRALNDDEAIERMRTMRGGIGALTSRASLLRKQTGQSVGMCVGGAVVDILNSKRGGKKLSSWWNEEA